MRIIPRKTKVATEFFTGVSLGDIVVGTVGVLLVFFVIVSNLPQKMGICGGIALIFNLLLVRIETEANYMFLFRIVKHFSYYRNYRKVNNSPFSLVNEPVADVKKEKKIKKKRKLREQNDHEEEAVESLSI